MSRSVWFGGVLPLLVALAVPVQSQSQSQSQAQAGPDPGPPLGPREPAVGEEGAAPMAPLVGLDLDALDQDGLLGPPDGKRALHYEFCIPNHQRPRAEVAAIDPRADFYPAVPGRSGCGVAQVLVIGSTHQPGFRRVLQRLAALPYVHRIQRADFE